MMPDGGVSRPPFPKFDRNWASVDMGPVGFEPTITTL